MNTVKIAFSDFWDDFDPNDNYVIADLPREYPDYLDRLEYALMAYRSGNKRLFSDDIFDIKRQ